LGWFSTLVFPLLCGNFILGGACSRLPALAPAYRLPCNGASRATGPLQFLVKITSVAGFAVYYLIKLEKGIRFSPDDEMAGYDIAMHNIDAYPEESLGG